MKTHRIALSAALLASTSLVSFSAALAQDTTQQPDDVIVVRYQYVPDDKRVTSEVSSFLSVDDLVTTGDSDIASALGRVTGVSITNGRFVVVRGLNERYSNTLINGSPLASPEPMRRAVPLDLFPTNLISNILIQKTFSAQFPGEFGGGLVEIETSLLPDDRFLDVSFSASANTATNFDTGLLYDGGSYDWTGFSDDTRDWPEQYQNIFDTQNIGPAHQDRFELANIGRNLENSKLWVVQNGDVGPNAGISFEAGDRFDFDDFSVGVLASLGYDNSWNTRQGKRGKARVSGDQLDLRSDFDRLTTTNTIELNGMFGTGVEFGDHEVQALAIVLRSTEKDASALEGEDDDRNAVIRKETTNWFERQVYTYQLAGDHTFELGQGFNVEWRLSHSDASRNAPNGRQAIYELETDGRFRLSSGLDGNEITFSRVDDVTNDMGIDFELPTTVMGNEWVWSAGWSKMDKERNAGTRLLGFGNQLDNPELLFSRIDYIFADQNIYPTRFFLQEVGGQLTPEGYKGALDVEAYYGSVDAELTPYLRASVGVRFEDGRQIVDTFNLPKLDPTDIGDNEGEIEEDYVLPAATVTWTFADNMQLRLGYSETITRPQFRELGYATFFNTETDERFTGNPYLTDTEITNFDARLEWYFGRDQFLTAGVFFKELENPIVEYVLPEGESLATSFLNAPSAELLGFELEFEKRFDFSDRFDGEFWENAEFFVKSNYTYTKSEMKASEDDIVILAQSSGGEPSRDERPALGYLRDGDQLQGQSEHLANLQVGWEDDNARTRTALLVNYTGERTRSLGALSLGLPEVIEELPTQVDLVHNRTVTFQDADYDVRFAVRNLLGEDYQATQSSGGSSVVVDSYEVGTTFSISLSRSF